MSKVPDSGADRMFTLISALPDQLERSADLADFAAVAVGDKRFARIILCGMGGSAIAGDLVQPLLVRGVSLTVWRNYGLPGWATAADLVICSSYSGDTEETLAAAAAAMALGCTVIAITSGGRLGTSATRAGSTVITLPGGLPPRASLGLGLGTLVRLLGRLGVVDAAAEEIAAATAWLRSTADARRDPAGATDREGNLPAAELAARLLGRIPVIFTAEPETIGPGLRLRAQLNENSKVPALVAEFPELNHNDLVGWDLDSRDRGRFVLVILRGQGGSPRIDRRVAVTRELLAAEFPEIHEIRSTATTALARTMSLVQYGDFVSCHLAVGRQVDPVPVDRIGRLKQALAE